MQVSFFEGDYDNVNNNKNVKQNKIMERKSLIHYLKPQHERVYIKVELAPENKLDEALISINPFIDKAQPDTGFTEISFR